MIFGGKISLEVVPERTSYLAGDDVRVGVTVSVEGERDVAVQEGRVELLYDNRYSYRRAHSTTLGTTTASDEIVVAAARFLGPDTLHGGSTASYDVSLRLPEQAPATARGAMTGVAWKVRATLALRHARDVTREESLTVFSPLSSHQVWGEQAARCSTSDCDLSFRLAGCDVHAGSHIAGVLVLASQVAAGAQGVRVELVRLEVVLRGQGSAEEFVEAQATLADDTALEPGTALEFPFDLIVPDGIPPSLETPQTSLHWLLRGVVDRALHPDYRVVQELNVYNGGAATNRSQES